MNKKLRGLAMQLVMLVTATYVWSQTAPKSAPPAPQPRKSEPFLHKVLRISGIGDSPATLKGPGDEVRSGQIWVIEVATKKSRSLTANGGYRSPVLTPGGEDIIALRGDDLVRLRRSGGNVEKLYTIKGISKLVGFSQVDADKALILVAGTAGNTTVGLLSVGTGIVEAVPYDSASSEERQMLDHLRSWDRVYGDKSVYVKRQSKQSLSGSVQWTDVFLKEGRNEPVNVSECDEVNCGQPSLSADGQFVVFVKAEH